MKLGFVTAILAELSFEDVLKVAHQSGYQCVEVMCWPHGKAERRYAGVTHIDVNDYDVEEIHSLCAKYGVSISGLGYYPNMLSADAAESETAVRHFTSVIDASAALGVNVANTFVGRDPKKTVDENWSRLLEIWPGIVAHAESRGVRIGIENCPMFFTKDEWPGGKNLATTPKIWRRLFSEIPSPNLGLNYDPSHLVWQMMDPIRPIEEFASRLVHVHAKDAKVDRAALDDVGIMATPLEYHSPVIPGRGDVDWTRFFSALRHAQYHGPVVVEVEDREFEGSLEDRISALEQSARFLTPLARD